jgi:hypothetical protein
MSASSTNSSASAAAQAPPKEPPTVPVEFTTPEGLRTLANFLRSSSTGVKVRSGIEHDKRVEYFKGTRTEPQS